MNVTQNYYLVYLVCVIIVVAVLQVNLGYEEPCIDSKSTVQVVPRCPTTEIEFNEAAQRKNCAAIPNTCHSFEYHCVRNWLSTELNEVCAPPIYIIGGVCAEYNEDRMTIRGTVHSCRNSKASCPERYLSTEQFKYIVCYELASGRKTSQLLLPLPTQPSPPPSLSSVLNITAISTTLRFSEPGKKNAPILWLTFGIFGGVIFGVALFCIYRVYKGMLERKATKQPDPEDPQSKQPLFSKSEMQQDSSNTQTLAQQQLADTQNEWTDTKTDTQEYTDTQTFTEQESADTKTLTQQESADPITDTQYESTHTQTDTQQESADPKTDTQYQSTHTQTDTQQGSSDTKNDTQQDLGNIHNLQRGEGRKKKTKRKTVSFLDEYLNMCDEPTAFPSSFLQRFQDEPSSYRDYLERHDDPSCWTTKDVVQYVTEKDYTLKSIEESFCREKIDGKAFMLLDLEKMMNYLRIPFGQALKLDENIKTLKENRKRARERFLEGGESSASSRRMPDELNSQAFRRRYYRYVCIILQNAR